MPYLNRFAESKVLLISFFTTLASSGHFLKSFFGNDRSCTRIAIKLEIQSIGYPLSHLPFKLVLFRRLLNFLCTTKQTLGEGRTRVFIGVSTPVGLEETISVIARN